MKTKGITPSTIGLILLCIGITMYFINFINGKIIETKPYLLLIMSILYLIAVYDIAFEKTTTKKKNLLQKRV
ncbi:MAG: hypothetical protein QXU92_02125 [Candidatus Diapherotrites archaeon]